MQAYDVKFSDWVQQGFALYLNHLPVLVVASLIAVVISFASLSILAGPMLAGMMLIILRLIDQREPQPDVAVLFEGFNYFLPAFLYAIGMGLASVILMGLFQFIPVIGLPIAYALVILLLTLTLFTLPNIVEGQLDVVSAVRKSVDLIKPSLWPMAAFTLIIWILGNIGVVAAGIGVAVTMPFYLCAMAVAYRDVLGKASSAG